VHAAHEQVGDDQYERPVEAALGVIPGFRDREGHHEQRRHRHGHGGTHDAGVGPGLVAKPGVRTPGPPQQREDEQALEYPQSVVRMHHVAGDLSHGEHVDEVEEELEGGGAIVFARGASAAEDPGASLACFGDDDHLFLAPLCQGVIASTLAEYSVLASRSTHTVLRLLDRANWRSCTWNPSRFWN
jgi:hypothetical protein